MYTNNILYRIYCRLILITLIVIMSCSYNLYPQIWVQTSGPTPVTNQVAAIVIDSTGHVFAGTVGGGVFVTTNNGDLWTAMNSGLTSTNVRALTIVSAKSIMAGTDDGVFLSTNSGSSWTHLNNGIGSNRVNKLVINRAGYIFAGTRGAGVFVSTDTGSTWTTTGLTGYNISALAVTSAGYVFVGTEGLTAGTYGAGIYFTQSNGASWIQRNTGLPSLPITSLTVSSTDKVYAGTYGSGVFLSSKFGQSWAQQDTGLPTNAYVYSLAINASSYIYAGLGNTSLGAYLSTDNAGTWTSFGLPTNNVAVFAIDTAGYLYAGTYEGGVYRTNSTTVVAPLVPTPLSPANLGTDLSTNEGFTWSASFGATGYRLQLSKDSTFATTVLDSSKISDTTFTINSLTYETKYFWRVNSNNTKLASDWSPVWKFTTIHAPGWAAANDSLGNKNIQSLFVSSSNTIFAGSYGGGVYRSTNNGTYWKSSGPSGTGVFSFAQNSSGNVFAGVGYFSSGVFLSTDQGVSWNSIGLTSSNTVAALAVNSSNWVFAGTYGSVYFSKDNGTTWNPVNNGLPSNPSVISLAINSSDYIFAGFGNNMVGTGIYMSKDNGTNWSFSGLASKGPIYRIIINSSNYVFAATDSGVYLSTDAGTNWIQDGLKEFQVNTMTITSDGKIFAATPSSGVYFTVDNGTTWTQINDGLNDYTYSIAALAVNSSGYIYAGMGGGGIYRAKISTFAVQSAPSLKSPANFSTDISITPKLIWSAVSGAYSYRLQVANDTAFTSPFFDTSGVKDTSYIYYKKLSLGTKYFWRVNASNEFGNSVWSNGWSFSTTTNQATASTNSATNISQNTATLNGVVNPKGLSTTVYFEYGPTTSYGYTATAVESPLTGNSNLTVTAAISNLAINTLYHYRVSATNTSGTISGADSTFMTLSTLATVLTSVPLNVNTSKATLTASVNPNGTSAIVKFQYGTSGSYGSTVTATQSPVSDLVAVNVSATITGLTQNTVYHYRVIAITTAGTAYGYDQSFTTYSTSVSLSHNYTFADPTQSSSYQLIGVPGNGSIALNTVISGTSKQDWDAYYDNGNTSNYLVEFSISPTFTFTPGNGFWVISKNAINISQSVSSVTIDTSSNYSIPLHSGWNIISNPFITSTAWSDVVSLNGLSSNALTLYDWSSSNWNQSTDMTPYIGYYIYNATGLTSLTIPYNAAGKNGKIIAPKKATEPDSSLVKELEIFLTQNSKKITSVFAAVNPKASVDYDQFDNLAPPADFQDQSISIINDSLSINYKKLIKDCRPNIGSGKEFDLVIKNKKGTDFELNFSGMNTFAGYECYLMNNSSKKFYNLSTQSTIAVTGNNLSYKLLIGNSDYIAKIKAAYAPDNFSLYQNYPNPFNPSTTISYTLQADSHVRLSVYNILGELVKDLFVGGQEQGYHELQFEASKFASGVYIYSIQANPINGKPVFTSSRKMILLK